MEVEIKLNVKPAIAGGPFLLFTKLTMQSHLAGLPLGPIGKYEMQDLYYDTPDGALARAGAGLRSRVINEVPHITLKVDEMRDGTLVSREEFEEPLTQERFEWVLSHIAHLIGEGPFAVEDFRLGRPVGNLVPILTVGTARLVRPIADAAVLALDMVEYPGLSANPYFDIEIESTAGRAGEDLLRSVETELYELAGGDLAPARQNKLERGLRLKEKGVR